MFEFLRQGYEALSRGDMDTFQSLAQERLDPQFEFHSVWDGRVVKSSRHAGVDLRHPRHLGGLRLESSRRSPTWARTCWWCCGYRRAVGAAVPVTQELAVDPGRSPATRRYGRASFAAKAEALEAIEQ